MENFFEWMLESSLLVLMVLGIRKIFTGRVRYAGIYALWILVLLRFMIPVNVISTPFSVGNLVSEALGSWRGAQTAENISETAVSSSKDLWQTAEAGKIPHSFAGKSAGGHGQAEFAEGRLEDDALPQGKEQEEAGTFSARLTGDGADWQRIFDTGRWVVSISLFLFFLLSNLVLMGKLRRDRVFYGTRGRIRIYKTSHIKNPCLYGFFCPAVYLCEMPGSGGISCEEMEQIITHECVHYRHRDHIWSMLCMVLTCFYWYDPFLWLAVSWFKKDAELFCDETVVGMLGEENRFSYGDLLLRMAGNTGFGDFCYSMMPMSRNGREMEKRIRAISQKKCYSKWVLVPLLLVAAFALGVTCSTGFRLSAREAVTADSAEGEPVEERKETGEKWTGTDGAGQLLPCSYPIGMQIESGLNPVWMRVGQASALRASSCEEAFGNYMEVFTQAVNTGKTDRMDQVLAAGSEVYEQQCALVKNYYGRGIREEILSYSIAGEEELFPFSEENGRSVRQTAILSREEIKVFYGDGTTKIVRQGYRYTCEERESGWIITKMDEAEE